MKKIHIVIAAVLSLFSLNGYSQSKVWQADLGNGEFQNPVLHADYSDPDVIRVGDDYYMTASSFNCVPGLPILHSKDLVNWTIVNYALQDLYLDGVTPSNFYDTPQHGKGVWAPSLRYHNGEFMIYWGDPDFGIYVVKSRDILSQWSEPILVLAGKGRIDPCPLFDGDKVYLVHAWAGSRARLNSVMTLCELNADGTSVEGEESLIYDGLADGNHTIEGGKFYKRGDYYYLLAPAGGVEMGWQIALRSKNIYGPYEVKTVLHQGSTSINGPHQGGLVETQRGEWWFLHFQDKGAYGRIVHSQRVEWVDGWPVMGVAQRDYCGEPALKYTKPNIKGKHSVATPQDSDEFNTPNLGLQWSWHANPQQTWGYASAMGYYRMYGQDYSDNYTNFWDIPNLLLQKFPAEEFSATMKAKFTLRNKDDVAGLIVMGWDYARLTLVNTGEGYELQLITCHDAEQKSREQVESVVELSDIEVKELFNYQTPVPQVDLYLRVSVKRGAKCQFLYSLDGVTYKTIGQEFAARQGKWIGAKMGMFIQNNSQSGERSWMDVDWFRVEEL